MDGTLIKKKHKHILNDEAYLIIDLYLFLPRNLGKLMSKSFSDSVVFREPFYQWLSVAVYCFFPLTQSQFQKE